MFWEKTMTHPLAQKKFLKKTWKSTPNICWRNVNSILAKKYTTWPTKTLEKSIFLEKNSIPKWECDILKKGWHVFSYIHIKKRKCHNNAMSKKRRKSAIKRTAITLQCGKMKSKRITWACDCFYQSANSTNKTPAKLYP